MRSGVVAGALHQRRPEGLRSGLSQKETERVMNDATDLAALKHISLKDVVTVLDAAEHGRLGDSDRLTQPKQSPRKFPVIHPAHTSNVSFGQASARGVTASNFPLDRAASPGSFPDASMTKHGVMQQGAR
jgi:hypothetical protein